MELGAIGCEALRHCCTGVSGRIEGRFSRALHLRSGGLVITFGGVDLPNHPFTIRSPAFQEQLGQDGEFHLQDHRLELGDYSSIDLSGLKEFSPCLGISSPCSPADQAACLETARQEAARGFPTGGLGWLLDQQGEENCFTVLAAPLVASIAVAVSHGNWTALNEPIRSLAGVGSGLTPSGDDFLCGLLSGLHFHWASCGYGPTPQVLRDLAVLAGERTSIFSAQMLRGAATGLVSEDINAWLIAVHKGENDAMAAVSRKIIEFGHSSGIDTLCGLIIGLESLLGSYQ